MFKQEDTTIQITPEDVNHAQEPSLWDFGNEVLYTLCTMHPKHDNREVIVAKILLIGRSYAAALERRRKDKGDKRTVDTLYEEVAHEIMEEKLDDSLSLLPWQQADPCGDLDSVLAVHKKLMNIFSRVTGQDKRSLASKYLHFHRPDLFFIYDLRAAQAIKKVTLHLAKTCKIVPGHADSIYQEFYQRCQNLQVFIKKEFCINLTPRQIDKILLHLTAKIGKDKESAPCRK